jgi:hypothetical protein
LGAARVNLPKQPWEPETVATIIPMTGGNFLLLNCLLTQMERILEINALQEVTKAVVEAAREPGDRRSLRSRRVVALCVRENDYSTSCRLLGNNSETAAQLPDARTIEAISRSSKRWRQRG